LFAGLAQRPLQIAIDLAQPTLGIAIAMDLAQPILEIAGEFRALPGAYHLGFPFRDRGRSGAHRHFPPFSSGRRVPWRAAHILPYPVCNGYAGLARVLDRADPTLVLRTRHHS
jgi:hypothetical protein